MAKVGSSAKFCVLVFKASLLWYWGCISQSRFICLPVHKTWQMNLLWPMTSQYQSRDDLYTTTKNLADEPTLADGCPIPEQR